MNKEKPVVWIKTEIKTPPFSEDARLRAGFLLRKLQQGEKLSMPYSYPLSIIGRRCHELRINDESVIWRIMYHIDEDSIVILEVFKKQTNKTPKYIIDLCKKRLRQYKNDKQ
ncbi:MAG: type II toxin-antitoxin system RelE/ParE family toxin [Candidatus Marinimicrobia bacterium]|nr:type II toxin-antitoxin system RelE/ParE family toxin [Candidatus Neomarinimicrobiota bacterium]